MTRRGRGRRPCGASRGCNLAGGFGSDDLNLGQPSSLASLSVVYASSERGAQGVWACHPRRLVSGAEDRIVGFALSRRRKSAPTGFVSKHAVLRLVRLVVWQSE